MKSGWPRKTLGEICIFVRGPFGGSLKKSVFVADGFAVYEQQHAIYDQFEEIRYFIDAAKFQEMQRFELRPNDLIMSCSGTMGKVAIVPENLRRGIINQALLKLTPTEAVSPEFLKYWMDSTDFQASLKNQSGGAAIQNVASVGILKGIQIPLPQLPEQQRIVGILDEAFAGIAAAKANAEKNLQNAHALFESHLHAVFTHRGPGWVEKRIEEWCDSVMDCVNKTAPVVEGPTPFKMIRTTNVRNGEINLELVKYVTEATYRIWTRRQVPQKGDVILTREAPMGEVGMLVSADTVFLGQRMVSYRVNPELLDNRFLLFALRSGPLQDQIHAKASGSTVQHMRVPDTKNLLLAAPTLPEQRRITARLDALQTETRRLEALYAKKLAALDELKSALLHQAFSGQL